MSIPARSLTARGNRTNIASLAVTVKAATACCGLIDFTVTIIIKPVVTNFIRRQTAASTSVANPFVHKPVTVVVLPVTNFFTRSNFTSTGRPLAIDAALPPLAALTNIAATGTLATIDAKAVRSFRLTITVVINAITADLFDRRLLVDASIPGIGILSVCRTIMITVVTSPDTGRFRKTRIAGLMRGRMAGTGTVITQTTGITITAFVDMSVAVIVDAVATDLHWRRTASAASVGHAVVQHTITIVVETVTTNLCKR